MKRTIFDIVSYYLFTHLNDYHENSFDSVTISQKLFFHCIQGRIIKCLHLLSVNWRSVKLELLFYDLAPAWKMMIMKSMMDLILTDFWKLEHFINLLLFILMECITSLFGFYRQVQNSQFFLMQHLLYLVNLTRTMIELIGQ